MRSVLDIAWKDLRLRLRDRSVLITGVLAPLILAFIFNGVFGDALQGGGAFEPVYAVVDLDRSDVSSAFGDVVGDLADDGVLELVEAGTIDAAEVLADDGDLDAFWVIPDGFGDAVTGGGEGTELEVVGSVDSPVASQVAESIASRFTQGIHQVALDVGVAASLGSESDIDSLVAQATALPPVVTVGDIATPTKRLDAPTAMMAGMAVFFLFFTVQFGVTSLLEERRDGTYPRLMAAPIPRWAPIAAKGLGAFVLGILSMAVLMVAARFLLSANWGPLLPVGLIVVAGVLSAVGIMGIVAAFARTPESAGNMQSIVGVVLGLLGGSFFPIGQDGGLLSRLQFLTPHAWFLRGLGDLAGDGTVASVMPAVAAMTAFALITGGIAWTLLRRETV